MHNETFFIDGVDARSSEIRLQKPITFSAPTPIVETLHVDGRNGDLVFPTGAYSNVKGEAVCFALSEKDVNNSVLAVNRFLSLAVNSYKRLEVSNDTEHYRLARVVNLARTEDRARTLNPFEIEFDCKPQRFVKDGENAIKMTDSGVLVNEYGFTALPFITVYGSGAGVLNIGSYELEIKTMSDVLYLDCENENAYNSNGNQNLNVNAPEFPRLIAGENDISFSGGITSIEIVPRWWEI